MARIKGSLHLDNIYQTPDNLHTTGGWIVWRVQYQTEHLHFYQHNRNRPQGFHFLLDTAP